MQAGGEIGKNLLLVKIFGYKVFCYLHRLYNGQHIQMLTALVLQLIQCIVTPAKNANNEATSEEQDDQQKEKKVRITLCELP